MRDLLDTSVWVEFLRGTDSPASRYVESRLVAEPATIATTEVIAMELLAGASGDDALAQVERLVDSLTLVRMVPALDFSAAAALHRRARRQGRTVRKLNDCLIAAIALRTGSVVVHRDADFEVLAATSGLQTRSFVDP